MGMDRDLTLLEALTSPEGRRRGSLGVSRVASMTGIDKGVVSRAFRTLEREGVVIRDPDTQGYRLGWRLPMLMVSAEVANVMRLANRTMAELANTFPGTVQSFVILRHNRAFLPYNISSGGVWRQQPWSANGYPTFCTACGRALLSDSSLADLRQMYPTGLELDEAPSSLVRNIEDLAKLTRVAHDDGYATSDREYNPDRASAAAPIRDHNGEIVAAINVSFLTLPDTQPARRQKLRESGREIARLVGQVSAELGWIPYPVG